MTDHTAAALKRKIDDLEIALARESINGNFEAAQTLRQCLLEMRDVQIEADLDEQAEAHQMALDYGYSPNDYEAERAEAAVELQRDWEADQADGTE